MAVLNCDGGFKLIAEGFQGEGDTKNIKRKKTF